MPVDFSELIYPLIPLCFALLSSVPAEERYFESQAKELCKKQNLQAAEVYVAAATKSAVALHTFIETFTGGILSLIISFHVWPPGWRYVAVVTTAFIFLLSFGNWMFEIFRFDLYQIAVDHPPTKYGLTSRIGDVIRRKILRRAASVKGTFDRRTYAQKLKRRETWFNLICAASIFVGWCWSQQVLTLLFFSPVRP